MIVSNLQRAREGLVVKPVEVGAGEAAATELPMEEKPEPTEEGGGEEEGE